MATIDIICPTWQNVFEYCNGKGWNGVFGFQTWVNPVSRYDIGSLNLYRFYQDSNKNSAPAKISYDTLLGLVDGYAEYQGTYGIAAATSLSYQINANKANIVTDPSTWTGAVAAGVLLLADAVNFVGQNFFCFYRFVGGVYEFKYFLCNGTKNMNNQGVFVNMLAANNQLAPNVDAPMVINIGDSDQQLRGIEAMEALEATTTAELEVVQTILIDLVKAVSQGSTAVHGSIKPMAEFAKSVKAIV